MTEENQKAKSKLPLLIGGGVIFVCLAAGGWWYFQQQNLAKVEAVNVAKLPATALVKKPEFLPLKKFVMSVKGTDRLHYLMLELSVMSYNEEQLKVLEDYMPVIRNAVLTKVGDKNYDQLSEQGIITVLQSELKEHLNKVMSEMASSHAIDKVLITKMVIQ